MPLTPVCAWPDGRVVSRRHEPAGLPPDVEGQTSLYFESAPSPGAPADVEFAFFPRVGVGGIPGQLTTVGFDAAAVTRSAGKLTWFVLNVGLVTSEDVLPRDLFFGGVGWAMAFAREEGVRRLLIPWFFSTEVRPAELYAPESEEDAEVAVRDLVSRTFPGESDVVVDHFNSRPGGYVSIGFTLRVPSLWNRSASFGLRGEDWIARDGPFQSRAATLGQVFLDVLRHRGCLPESERAAWEAQLEPGTFVHDDSLFRLLGEPSPVLWPQDRFLEWVSGG